MVFGRLDVYIYIYEEIARLGRAVGSCYVGRSKATPPSPVKLPLVISPRSRNRAWRNGLGKYSCFLGEVTSACLQHSSSREPPTTNLSLRAMWFSTFILKNKITQHKILPKSRVMSIRLPAAAFATVTYYGQYCAAEPGHCDLLSPR